MDIILYGFGGFGYSVAEIAVENGYKTIGVFDENEPENITLKNGKVSFLGKYNAKIYPNVPLVITIGNNEIRAKIAKEIKHKLISLIHHSAQVSDNSKIENGCIIMQNVVIQANTIIKNHCIINASVVIDHDCVVENFVHIRPMVYIGSNSSISTCSTINPSSFIERFNTI